MATPGYQAMANALITAVPEPGSVVLLGLGGLATLAWGRRRRSAAA